MDSLQKRLKNINHELADSPTPAKRFALREEERYVLKIINNSHMIATAAAELTAAKKDLESVKESVARLNELSQDLDQRERAVFGMQALLEALTLKQEQWQERVESLKQEKVDIDNEWQESRAVEATMHHQAGQR